MRLLIVLFFFGQISNCQNQESMSNSDPVDVIKRYVREDSRSAVHTELKMALKEKVNVEAKENVSMSIYGRYAYETSEVVIVSKDGKKALLMTGFIKKNNHGKVDLWAATKSANGWSLNHAGLPGFAYEYDEELREGQEFSMSEIFDDAIFKISADGLVRDDTIQQDYLKSKWF